MDTMSWDGELSLNSDFNLFGDIMISSTFIYICIFFVPDIRKRARNLENDIDLKLVALSKISSGSMSSGESSPLLSSEFSFDTISLEIEDMLSKLSEMNEKMANVPTSGAAMMHTLTRHRDILHSYRTEFNKITQNHTIQVEREELLRGSGLMNGSGGGSVSRRDMFVKESQHISK